MAATYALSIAATSAKVSPYDFKKPTYGHMNLGFLQQKVIINGAIFSILALKRTLEKLIEMQERGQHDEAIEALYFQKFYNPPIVRMFNPYYNEDEDFLDFDPWEGFSTLLVRQTCIDFLLVQTQRWYEDLACMKLPMEVSRKLCGEIKTIATPSAQSQGRLSASAIVFQASMESKLLFCTAGLTLNVVERMYQIACNGQPKGLSMTRYLTYNVPVEIFKRVGVRLLVMSASAAIGTLVKPGVGTTMVVLVVDFALMPPIYNSINRAAGIM